MLVLAFRAHEALARQRAKPEMSPDSRGTGSVSRFRSTRSLKRNIYYLIFAPLASGFPSTLPAKIRPAATTFPALFS